MSESLGQPKVGVHELLRYMLPGYTFLFITFLPIILSQAYDLMLFNLEFFLGFFLIGGFVIGYLLYYPYYWYFRKFCYTEDSRASLRIAREKLGEGADNYNVLALHSLAYYSADKNKTSIEHCIFEFSVVHSIGSTALAILLGAIVSSIMTLALTPESYHRMLQIMPYELLTLALVIPVLTILCKEYNYRLKLATRTEDYIVMSRLEDVIKENEDASKKFQNLAKREKRE